MAVDFAAWHEVEREITRACKDGTVWTFYTQYVEVPVDQRTAKWLIVNC